MDESWERAVEAAFNGETDVESIRTLTLDGAVKCVNGRLPQPSILEKYHNLEHLSIANTGVSSLEKFPRLKNLQKLILSDNRIAGGLQFLVEAGLQSLSDLDLSNNRVSDIDELKPLAELRLVSLDLYECPVTRVKDYRCIVFGLIKSLKYLDKMDAEENDRPESDDEEDDDEEDDDDALSGEIDGEDYTFKPSNGVRSESDVVVDADEDERSDTDEEGCETSGTVTGASQKQNSNKHSNGFKDDVDEKLEDGDAMEAHEIYDDDDDVEYGAEDDEDGEDPDDDERVMAYPLSSRQCDDTEGEIDSHDHLGDDDDDGETDEEVKIFEEDGDFEDDEAKDDLEDDNGSSYLVQPIQVDDGGINIGDEEEAESFEDESDEDEYVETHEISHKRKREEDESDEEDDDDDSSEDEDDDDTSV